jgi:hypothetical protein
MADPIKMPERGKRYMMQPITKAATPPPRVKPAPAAKPATSQRMATPAAQKKAAGVQSAKSFTPAVAKKASGSPKRPL